MKTPLSSTFSSLAALAATAVLLFTAYPALAEGSGSPNNPDKVCKYKKKCPSCDGTGSCDDSDPDKDTKTKTVGHNEECPDPVTASFGEDYELVDGGGTRSSRSVKSPVIIRSGFGADFINPKNLNVYGQAAEVVRDANANVRQIKTDTGFLDVISMPEAKTVELRQYNPEDIGSGKVDGVYPIKEGRIPLVVLRYVQEEDDTIRVDTIDNANEFPSIKSERTKQTAGPKPYTITQQKTYLKGEGLSVVEYRRVGKTITGIPGGQPKEEKYLLTTEDMGTDGQWHVTERKTGRRAEYKAEDGLVTLYECNAVKEDGTPMNPIATETTYTYYTDPMKPESFGKIRTLRRNDGYWENKYYDENANAGIEIEKTESPWLNTAAHDPGGAPAGKIRIRTEVSCSTDSGVESVTETVDGIPIAKEWTEKSPVNQLQVKEVRHQPHSGGDKVTTTVRYRRAKDVPDHLTGRTVSVHNADGSMSLYLYALNGQNLTITEDTGCGEGNSVSHGTRTVSTQDRDSGNLKEEVRYALEEGQAYWLGSKTGVNFDNKGVCLKWVYDNNPDDYTELRKDCCQVIWSRGRDGCETVYNYDAQGRILSETKRGISKICEYKGLKTTIFKKAAGNSLRYLVKEEIKDLSGNIVEEKAPTVGGNILINTYDNNIINRTKSGTNPYGSDFNIIHMTDGQVASETGENGLTTIYSYTPSLENNGSMIISEKDNFKIKKKIQDFLGNVIFQTLSSEGVTIQFYDIAGRLIKRVLPDREIELFSYGKNGEIAGGKDLDGDSIISLLTDQIFRTRIVFDESWPENKGSWKNIQEVALKGNWVCVNETWQTEDGTQIRSRRPGINGYAIKEFSSIKEMNKNYSISSISPSGKKNTKEYFIENGIISGFKSTLTDSNNSVITQSVSTVNVWGNIVKEKNSRTGEVNYEYDEVTGKLLKIVNSKNEITTFKYDYLGRNTEIVLPDNTKQFIEYDKFNNILKKWGSQIYPVKYKYNEYNDIIEMCTYRNFSDENWEGSREKTTWIYDENTQYLIEKNYADGSKEKYFYTKGGKIERKVNVRGMTSRYEYDLSGNLIYVYFDSDDGVNFNHYFYDQLGRLSSVESNGISQYTYYYNEANKIYRENVKIRANDGFLERDIYRLYDDVGRLISCNLKNGEDSEQKLEYFYDGVNRINRITVDEHQEFLYSFVPNSYGLISQISAPFHDVINEYESKKDILLSKTNKWKDFGNRISSYHYETNSLEQRISVKMGGDSFSGREVINQWSYDSFGQLSKENDTLYSYDSIGNRKSLMRGENYIETYQVNSLNQYEKYGNELYPKYDKDGNLIENLMRDNSNIFSFNFDLYNRISKLNSEKYINTYSYDYRSRRIIWDNKIIIYDGFNAIAEYDFSTKKLLKTYAWGLDLQAGLKGMGGVGALLSETNFLTQIPSISCPTYDGNGNISEYINNNILCHYEYDAFGRIINKVDSSSYRYNFSTKAFDSKTGLLCYGYRDYDAYIGRFIQRDPSSEDGGLNLYCFSANSPINNIDILGLESDCTQESEKVKNIEKQIKDSTAKMERTEKALKEKLEELKLDKDALKHGKDGVDVPNYKSRRAHWKVVNQLKAKIAQQRANISVLQQSLAGSKCAKSVCEKLLKKGVKKCFGFACRKTPLAFTLFMIDKSSGGTEYAINEFTWPVSEAWRDDNIWDDDGGDSDGSDEPSDSDGPSPSGGPAIWPIPPGSIPVSKDDWLNMTA